MSLNGIKKCSVILFPGQGTQYVGMSQNLCDKARSLFDISNQVLGYDLLKLCNKGPERELNRTEFCQTAVFVSSLAAVENLSDKSRGAVENCVATAGFSLGEFSALVFAQSIEFIDALRLIKLRAEVTQKLCEETPSGMMTVIYGNNGKIYQACELAREFCIRSGITRDESICSVSNHLFPHCKVVAGHQKALDFLEQNGKDFGFRRTKRLPVSGAFHTRLMKPAMKDLKNSLSKISIKTPKIPVYSNVTASVHTDPSSIKDLLVKHVSEPVKFEQMIRNIYCDISEQLQEEQLPATFECGPQNTLTTILGMVNTKARKNAYNIE